MSKKEEEEEEEFYRKGWFDRGENGKRIVTSVMKVRKVMNQLQYFVRFSGGLGTRTGLITIITLITLLHNPNNPNNSITY
jgi:protein tyrosine phosphatase